jgi:hypothetical protein
VRDQDTPKLSGPNPRQGVIKPPEVLPALPAKGHAPAISRKPGLGFSGVSEGHGTGAGDECAEIAFDTRRIDEQVPIATVDQKPSVRVGHQVSTGCASIRLRTVSTNSVH